MLDQKTLHLPQDYNLLHHHKIYNLFNITSVMIQKQLPYLYTGVHITIKAHERLKEEPLHPAEI